MDLYSDNSINNIPFVYPCMEFRRRKKKSISSGNLATGFSLRSVTNRDVPSSGGSDMKIITKCGKQLLTALRYHTKPSTLELFSKSRIVHVSISKSGEKPPSDASFAQERHVPLP